MEATVAISRSTVLEAGAFETYEKKRGISFYSREFLEFSKNFLFIF